MTLASCVAMQVSNSFYQQSLMSGSDRWHPDPARLAAGILAGMGFLGAGVIIHERRNVIRGITTAATIWLASIIGIAIGAGSISIGLVSTLLAFGILSLMPGLENHLPKDWYADLTVRLEPGSTTIDDLQSTMRDLGLKIKGLNWEENLVDRQQTLHFHLRSQKVRDLEIPRALMEELSAMPGVRSLSWKA